MTNMDTQYDNALLGILQNEGKLEKFLDVIFGFLMRRTDFFYIMTPEQRNIGFSPGVSIQMILKAYEKYKTIFDNYQRRREAESNQSTSKSLSNFISETITSITKEEPKNTNIPVSPPSSDKDVCDCPSNSTSSGSKNEENESRVYQADPDCYNGATRDNYTWSQTIKDIDIKIKVPESVMNARCVSVNIERKHIRISIRQNGKETVYFDRDLCWDIHKNDAMWTFHSKENQIHLCLDKIQERWWEAAFDGEDKINTRKIDCSRPMHELDDEAQAKIQQLMYDEQRKRQGLLTSEQEKIQNILASAWNKEGSPFQGTQYDPTKVKLEGSSMHIQT
ncbi:NudC domain-containing protein isoform 1 [Schistosoma japonicum]|uniref:NudC domain-containing protein isoform 1 n=1 Tax=Schistosoma japonicum TaxID=6182 RepID=Q5DAE2_SCHJA|nr:SJCHGC02542 protein [Schistosoma japonicum]TNN13285.1 NudC domain-containing protein isoform 1 [Schistosoma japonicum]